MKYFFIFLMFISSVAFTRDPEVTRLETKPDLEFTPPQIQIYQFPNGLTLYFLPNKELPLIRMSALVGVGKIHDPSDKSGLVSLLFQTLRTGGTEKLSGDELDSLLDQKAASIGVETTAEFSKVSFRSQAKDLDSLLPVFFDVLRSPRLDLAKFEFNQKQLTEAIRRQNEDPQGIASRLYRKELLGFDNPWAKTPTQKSIQSITLEDIRAFHHAQVGPNRVWLAVSGDIPFRQLINQISKTTRGWDAIPNALPKIKRTSKEWTPQVGLVSRPLTQSSVVMGHFGDWRFNPDKYAITLANYVLGLSTFGSRLGNKIRTELGLVYSIYSNFELGSDLGVFEIAFGTQTNSTVKAIEETKAIFKDFVTTHLVTEAELAVAKKTILNQLIFQYDEPFQIVESRVYYDYLGYPPDYLTIYQREIRKVTLNDVHKAVEKYFFPDRLQILVVGNGEQLNGLSELGQVKTLKLEE